MEREHGSFMFGTTLDLALVSLLLGGHDLYHVAYNTSVIIKYNPLLSVISCSGEQPDGVVRRLAAKSCPTLLRPHGL